MAICHKRSNFRIPHSFSPFQMPLPPQCRPGPMPPFAPLPPPLTAASDVYFHLASSICTSLALFGSYFLSQFNDFKRLKLNGASTARV